jgi:putative RecB family exonuclease
MGFTNEHLSFSRLERFERCPKSFKLKYIEGVPSDPGPELRFGKAMHWTLENLVAEHCIDGREGALPLDLALTLWQIAWNYSDLSGVALFAEGEEMIRTFVRREGIVHPGDVLGIEKKFGLTIGRFEVVGSIDRVDVVNATTIRIRDYKTNQAIFGKDEVEDSLQLSLYAMAAQAIWPWATTIELEFHMLRHDLRLRTSRTPEQLAAARRYIEAMGTKTETATDYPARLRPTCVNCDYRKQCNAYLEARDERRDVFPVDLADLDAVSKERETFATIAKIASARKAEMEDVIRARLDEAAEVVAGGVRYTLQHAASVEYPLEPTLEALEKATGLSRVDLLLRLASIEKDSLAKLLKDLAGSLPRPKVVLLKAEIEARATRTMTPRFHAKEVRS